MDKLRNLLTDVRISVAIAGLAVIGYIVGLYDMVALNTLLALAGFQGLASIRALIDSSGYKTYILAGLGALMVAALFMSQQFHVISPENLQVVMKELVGITLVGGSLTLHHAKKKAER